MPNYRRAFVPGGMYFFTVVTEGRAPILIEPQAQTALRKAFLGCRSRWPFEVTAIVLLPDHLHTIWALPAGDSAYSRRWAWIKKEFARAWVGSGGVEQPLSQSRCRNRRRGVWQRRFWEHWIRDEDDLERHIDYLHANPVKHGLVTAVRDWPYSSFHRFVRLGSYPLEWSTAEILTDVVPGDAGE